MEESRKYLSQSSPFTSQPVQTSFNATAENRGTSPTMRMIPSDRQIYQPTPSVGASSSPVGHVSTAMPTYVQYQLPANHVKTSAVSNSSPSSGNLGRDSSSTSFPRVDRPHIKVEGGPNGSSYASPGQVSSSNPHSVNAPTWSVQSRAGKSGQEQIKQPTHMPVKVDASPQMNVSQANPLPPRDQNFVPIVPQPHPGLQSIHQPSQPVNYSQASSLTNSHNEIAKIVQKLLQPKLPDHPTWIPPSRDYMNKALTCQICHLTISDVDNVLVCDACEKGYHTKCAQPSNQRVIPRGEWHCSRCLAVSNGKPLPPKYGRVMRSNTPVKVPSSTGGVQTLTEKKVGKVEPKVNEQNATANGTPAQTGDSDGIDLSADSKSLNAMDTQKGNSLSVSRNVHENPVLGSFANNSLKSAEAASASSTICLSESSAHLVNNSEPLTCKEESVERKPMPDDHLSDTVGNRVKSSQPSHNSHVLDKSERPNSSTDATEKHQDHNPMVAGQDKLKLNENSECNLREDGKQDSAFENTVASSAAASEIMEHSGNSSDESLSVEWIGDAIQVVDDKTFYQTCCLHGVMYKVQDHVLFRTVHGKLTPSKIQSMWEDGKTGSRWVIVNRYIFPSDLPENLGHPCSTDSSEVYESNQRITAMAGHIKGPCQVLPQTKFEEESQRRNQLAPESNSGLPPVYLCKWLYDEVKGSFQPISG